MSTASLSTVPDQRCWSKKGLTRQSSGTSSMSSMATLDEKRSIRFYTGCVPTLRHTDELGVRTSKVPVSGYQGHIHGFGETISKTFREAVISADMNSTIPKRREDVINRVGVTKTKDPRHLTANRKAGAASESMVEQSGLGSMFTNFRRAHEGLSTRERYDLALEDLSSRGQAVSLNYLQEIVRNKIGERCRSYGEQVVKVRKMFEYFDLDGSGTMDEDEFRQCLEMLNCQLTDEQSLALFASLDKDCSGTIDWQEFADRVMVFNPAGGGAIMK